MNYDQCSSMIIISVGFFLLQRIIDSDCVLNFDFLPKKFRIPDNWWIICIPRLFSDWKMFSDFPRLPVFPDLNGPDPVTSISRRPFFCDGIYTLGLLHVKSSRIVAACARFVSCHEFRCDHLYSLLLSKLKSPCAVYTSITFTGLCGSYGTQEGTKLWQISHELLGIFQWFF